MPAKPSVRQERNPMVIAYDYEKLAYELYRQSDDLIEDLISIRRSRNMSTKKLADKMSIQEETILGLENGSLDPAWHLLVDYALEIGASLHIRTGKAEEEPKPHTHPKNTSAGDNTPSTRGGRLHNMRRGHATTSQLRPSRNHM